MQKLYRLLEEKDVLNTVTDAVCKTQQMLILVQGQVDNSPVQPDNRYFKILNDLCDKKIKIRRYYFGSKEAFDDEKVMQSGIEWRWAGSMEAYQRAIIIDGKKAFFKIGTQFAVSEYPPLIELLTQYLENCCLAAVGNLG